MDVPVIPEAEPEPQHISDFAVGDKIRHVSYPEGVYAEIVEQTAEQTLGWAYGLDDTPIQFAINEGTGGLGNEWFPYEETGDGDEQGK